MTPKEKAKNATGAKKISEMIADAIIEDPYFSKDTLVPKINALIKSFKVELNDPDLNLNEKKGKLYNIIMSKRLHQFEKKFWRKELIKIVGEENQSKYNDKLDLELIKSGWVK